MPDGMIPIAQAVGPGESRFGQRAQIALVGALVLVFFTGSYYYVFERHAGPPASYWVALFVLLSVLLGAARPRTIAGLFQGPLLVWSVGYLVVSVLWWFPAAAMRGADQVLIDRVRSVALLLAAAVIVSGAEATKASRFFLVWATLQAVLLNGADFFGFVEINEISGRAAGLYVNPNGAGIAIALGLFLSVDALAPRWRGWFVAAAAAGVTMTFSRGAFICLGAVVAWLLFTRRVSLLSVVVAVAASVAVVVAFIGSHLELLLNEETYQRLSFDMADANADERIYLIAKALDMIRDAPFLGRGTGASLLWDESESSHNMLLNMAVDHGAVGILLFLWLLVAVARGGKRQLAFSLLFGLIGIFSHNLLDDPMVLVSLAIGSSRAPCLEGKE